MEQKDIKYFEGRLDKNDYSKEEVAKLLHSESEFTERTTKKSFDGYVPQDKFNEMQTKLNDSEKSLGEYKGKEFNENLDNTFNKFNGKKSRSDDFKKLGGFTGEEDTTAIESKIIEMKKSENYGFLFKNNDSGGSISPSNFEEVKLKNKKNLTPQTGLLDTLFNKKKK